MEIQKNIVEFASLSLQEFKIQYALSDSFNKLYQKDIINGIYEGGFKLWECTLDLLAYLEKIDFQHKKVLEIGCGHGLLGILALLKGATLVTFQDFNKQVIQFLTIPNINQNIQNASLRCSFLYGDWDNLQRYNVNIIEPFDGQYDIILGSELIYQQKNYEKIIHLIKRQLKINGCAILANKHFYFGVGGNMNAFKEYIQQSGDLTCQSLQKIIPKSGGNKKEIIKIIKSASKNI